jgi:hypothetical protein
LSFAFANLPELAQQLACLSVDAPEAHPGFAILTDIGGA